MPLFGSVDGARWFDVPDGLELPDGELEVRTMLGARRAIDPIALGAYEIPRERARERGRQELVAMIARAGSGVEQLQGLVAERGHAPPEALEPLKKILEGVDRALRREGDPAAPPPKLDREALTARLEEWVRRAVDDPSQVEQLRQAARDLQSAADRLKAAQQSKKPS